MKVRYSAADQGGCGHYRLIWPAQALAAQGHDVDVATAHVDPDTDVIVVQRPLRSTWADSAIPTLQAAGIAVVVEIDDDFAAIDPQNAAWRPTHPRWSPDVNYQHLARAARMADLVTVSTPALQARYGGHILPNYIPENYLSIAPDRPSQLLGWTGTPLTHPGDLDVARAGIQQALRANPDWQFRSIGSRATLRSLGVDGDVIPWQPDMLDYANAYGTLSAAVVPLKPSRFNEAKSWLKGLEAAALGVPFIASPTEQYRALTAHGVGLLAEKPKDWTRQLGRLLSDATFRTDQVSRGLAVAKELTVEKHAWKWAEAWDLAVKNRQSRSAA